MKYIFVKDMQLVTKSTNRFYHKGEIVDFTDEEALQYISMGVLTKYVLTVKILREKLNEASIEYPNSALKKELLKLYEDNINVVR